MVLALAFILFVVLVEMNGSVLRGLFIHGQLETSDWISIALVTVLSTYAAFVTLGSITRERTQALRLESAEAATASVAGFDEFLPSQLSVVAERARLVMVQAQNRAGSLYFFGILVAIIAVLVPVVAVYVYVGGTSMSAGDLESLSVLRFPDGQLPDGVTISIGRDWRVLLSGVSFGALFLATAGALFTQHRRQMENRHIAGTSGRLF